MAGRAAALRGGCRDRRHTAWSGPAGDAADGRHQRPFSIRILNFPNETVVTPVTCRGRRRRVIGADWRCWVVSVAWPCDDWHQLTCRCGGRSQPPSTKNHVNHVMPAHRARREAGRRGCRRLTWSAPTGEARAWTRWTPGSSWSRPSPSPITPPAISTMNTPWLPARATRQEDTCHPQVDPAMPARPLRRLITWGVPHTCG